MHKRDAKPKERSSAEFFQLPLVDPEHTTVCFGGAGANAALATMKRNDPQAIGNHKILVLESNAHVLAKHFVRKEDPSNPDTVQLFKWLDSGRLKIIPLGEGLGAGGNTTKGEAILKAKEDEIRAFLETAQVVVQVGGGGGGTASGAMPLVAEMLNEMTKPTYSILTYPRFKEGGDKIAKANRTRDRLLELHPLTVVYNEMLADRSVSYHKMHGQVNDACLFPVLGFLQSLTQRVGDVQDIDTNDWISALLVGNHALPGYFNAAKGLDGFDVGLLGNPYLNNRIIEKALHVLFWFDGDWPIEEHDRVVDLVQEKMHRNIRDAGIEMKWGIREEGVPEGEKSVGLVAFAKEAPDPFPDPNMDASGVRIFVPALPFGSESDGANVGPVGEGVLLTMGQSGNGHGAYVPFNGVIGGEKVVGSAPAELVARYGTVWAKQTLTPEVIAEAKELQQALEKATGKLYDVPGYYRSNVLS